MTAARRAHPGRRVAALLAVAACAIAAGCRPTARPHQGYFGPTCSIEEAIARINANNRAIPTLYARHYTEANIIDPRSGRSTFVNAGGDLLLRKPRELLMRGRKDLAGAIFEIGSTADRYWMTILVGDEGHWWGFHRNAERLTGSELPVRPDLLGEVLGIADIDPVLTQPPVPVLRFNNDLDVYMLLWSAPLPDRWYAQKEIWYDRATLLPRKVLLFDRDGRVVVRADLAEHRQIAAGAAAKDRPWMASAFDLFFPASGSTMKIQLSDMALTTRTGHPREGSIRCPDEPPVPADRVFQIDRHCER